MWRRDIQRAGWIALLMAGTLAAADRGIAIKVPADAGLSNYDPKRLHALVIGISEYKHWADLHCAADDAKSMASALRDVYGYGDVKLLLNEQATRKGILVAIDQYTELGEEDSLLIYYAGHGWMDKRKTGFWIPADAPEDDKFSYIPNSQLITDYFKKFKVRHLLVIADSCFSGSMLRGRTAERPDDWDLPAGFRKPSRWIMTSGDLAPVPDDTGSGHSPFATRLLQYMKHSDQPAFGIQDLYVYVRKNLESGAICQPMDTPAHMPGGEFTFCRLSSDPPPQPPAAPDTVLAPATPDTVPAPATPDTVPAPDPIKIGSTSSKFLSLFTPPPPPAKPKPPAATKTAVATPPPAPAKVESSAGAAPAATTPPQAPANVEPPADSGTTGTPTPKPGTGTVVIRSLAGGLATVDKIRAIDISAGKPCVIDSLKPGKHAIRVVSGRKTWQCVVVTEAGKVQDLSTDFPAEMQHTRPTTEGNSAQVRPRR